MERKVSAKYLRVSGRVPEPGLSKRPFGGVGGVVGEEKASN